MVVQAQNGVLTMLFLYVVVDTPQARPANRHIMMVESRAELRFRITTLIHILLIALVVTL